MGYGRSPFQDFESYLRIVVGSDEDDFQLILKHINSTFIKCEIPISVFSLKDFSGAVNTMGDHERTLQITNVDNVMETTPV